MVVLPTQHIVDYDLYELFQSARKTGHSHTTLTRIYNDILCAIENEESVILVLLDLSSAFDIIEHHILLDILKHRYGMTSKALAWLRSYLMKTLPVRSDYKMDRHQVGSSHVVFRKDQCLALFCS